jgi:hypothetical protein
MSDNVVSLKDWKEKKAEQTQLWRYKAKLLGMDKLELLDELVKYTEERTKVSKPSHDLIERGITLAKVLADVAETAELRESMLMLGANLMEQKAAL